MAETIDFQRRRKLALCLTLSTLASEVLFVCAVWLGWLNSVLSIGGRLLLILLLTWSFLCGVSSPFVNQKLTKSLGLLAGHLSSHLCLGLLWVCSVCTSALYLAEFEKVRDRASTAMFRLSALTRASASAFRSQLPEWLFPVPFVTDFTIHNLPYGVFSTGSNPKKRLGVAIGDKVLDLSHGSVSDFLCRDSPQAEEFRAALQASTLNLFAATEQASRRVIRQKIKELIETCKNPNLFEPLENVKMHLPFEIGDYTDFYASEVHAVNVGRIFRPNAEPLLPNWKHLPVGYHGRASSVVVSGTDVYRPAGQVKPPTATQPFFSACQKLDYEVEMGVFLGGSLPPMGTAIPIEKAENHIYGFVLLNDWSARDLQAWEYVPLGPFLGKNFGTTISPWVVPLEALAPFRVPLPPLTQKEPNPVPLEYLRIPLDQENTATFDIPLTTQIVSAAAAGASVTSCATNLRHLYWSVAQMLTHHSVNGCPMRVGDLLGTGTISAPVEALTEKEVSTFGSLLEASWNSTKSLRLENGSEMTMLRDGDTVVMRGTASTVDPRTGETITVGFGECTGTIQPTRHPLTAAAAE